MTQPDKLMSAPDSHKRCQERFSQFLDAATGITEDLQNSNHVALSANELWLLWKRAWFEALVDNGVLRVANE